jgi:DNA-3-methyladenine glycosylase
MVHPHPQFTACAPHGQQEAVRLPRSFFNHDTLQVARELLGCTLVHMLDDGTRLSGRIVETEAYLPGDPASHGFRGRTKRNTPMFMQAGTAYVYFIYGMHFCFNVVTEGEGVPAAVLIRAVQPAEGLETMQRNRTGAKTRTVSDLCNGPGKLCQAFAIDRRINGIDLCNEESRLFIEASERVERSDLIEATPRIGISGDEATRNALWRFVLTDV